MNLRFHVQIRGPPDLFEILVLRHFLGEFARSGGRHRNQLGTTFASAQCTCRGAFTRLPSARYFASELCTGARPEVADTAAAQRGSDVQPFHEVSVIGPRASVRPFKGINMSFGAIFCLTGMRLPTVPRPGSRGPQVQRIRKVTAPQEDLRRANVLCPQAVQHAGPSWAAEICNTGFWSLATREVAMERPRCTTSQVSSSATPCLTW